jgi:hypothetical protein
MIWLNNQDELTNDPNIIPILTKMIINRLWRFYNRGTKLMFLQSFPNIETSELQQNKVYLLEIIEKCGNGGLYSDTYKQYGNDIKNLEIAMKNSKNYRLKILESMLE